MCFSDKGRKSFTLVDVHLFSLGVEVTPVKSSSVSGRQIGPVLPFLIQSDTVRRNVLLSCPHLFGCSHVFKIDSIQKLVRDSTL